MRRQLIFKHAISLFAFCSSTLASPALSAETAEQYFARQMGDCTTSINGWLTYLSTQQCHVIRNGQDVTEPCAAVVETISGVGWTGLQAVPLNFHGDPFGCGAQFPVYSGPSSALQTSKSVETETLKNGRKECGSQIDVAKKTVSEAIPIQGTSFLLVYSSEYNFARKSSRSLGYSWQFLEGTSYAHVVKITSAGSVQSYNYPAFPTLRFDWTWDGVTGADNSKPFISKAQVNVALNQIVPIEGWPDFNAKLFEENALLLVYRPEAWGLSGWTVNVHHYFDRGSKTMFWGTGESQKMNGFKTISLAPYGSVDLVPSLNGKEVYIFDQQGRHLETRNAFTNSSIYRFLYSPDNKLAEIKDIDGQSTIFHRDSSGLLTSVEAPFENVTAVTLSPSGLIATATTPLGTTYSMDYDTQKFLTTFTRPDGLQTAFSYDSDGNFTREDKNNGFFQSFVDTLTDLTKSVVHNTNAGTIGIDEVARIGTKETIVSKDGSGAVRSKREDTSLSTRIEQDEMTTEITYANDEVWGSLAPKIYSRTINASENRPGSFANFSLIQYPNKSTVLADFSNPLSAQQISIQESVPFVNLRTVYDVGNRTLKTTDSNNRVTTTVFNSSDRPIRIFNDNLSTDISLEYFPNGLLSKVKQSGREVSYSYDTKGNVLTMTESGPTSSATTQFLRLPNGLVHKVIAANGEVTNYEYTSSGALKKIVTSSGAEHIFEYEIGDLLSSTLNPFVSSVTNSSIYEYDVNKRLAKVTKPSGRFMEYQYKSGSNWLKSIRTSSGTNEYTELNASGRVQTAKSSDNVQTSYVWMGPVITEEKYFDTDGSVIATLNYDYAYHSPLLTQIRINNQQSIGFDYGNELLIKNISVGTAGISYTYSKESATEVTNETFFSSGTASAVYKTTSTGRRTAEHRFAKGSNGKLVKLEINDSPETGLPQESKTAVFSTLSGAVVGSASFEKSTHSYDQSKRLIASVRQTGPAEDQITDSTNVSYAMPIDKNGNITSYTAVKSGTTLATNAQHDAQDRLLSLQGSVNREYAYNDDGDMMSMTNCFGTVFYDYDEYSNLKKVTLPSGKVIEYKVDAFNRRIKKLVNGATQEYYLWYDSTRLAAVLDKDKKFKLVYVYGPTSRTPVAVVKGGITYKVISDPDLGSIRYVVDVGNGTIVQEMAYDAYGNIMKNSNPDFQPLGFAGGLMDKDTRLVRFGARDYDPTIGRWTTKDPIGFEGGNNFYEYGRSNPVAHIDPSGLSYIKFNRSTGTLSVYDKKGNLIGTFNASNNVVTTAPAGNVPVGQFAFSHWTSHPESSQNGPYGSFGNFVFAFPNGTGIGVHAGRANSCDSQNRCGYEYNTLGCVRTTDTATQFLFELNITDPLQYIIVEQ
jgi:RHS repeat-associated protein